MKKLIVASNNEHKIREIKQILKDSNFEIMSLKEAGIDIDVEETGKTFMENAILKAEGVRNLSRGAMVLSDDSGLMVDALDGAPGVFSARFAGEHGNSKKNNEKLLKLLQGKSMEERKAKFVCAMALIVDENLIIKVEGKIDGYIGEKEMGVDGFGYDPLFYVPKYDMAFAEMTEEMKNSMSHRGNALKALKEEIQKYGL